MEINTQNSSGMMNGMPPMSQNPQEKKVGPIVGALIIVLLLIIAALYFFGQKLNTQNPSLEAQQAANQAQIQDQKRAQMNAQTATTTQPDDVQSMKSDLDIQMKDVDYSF